MASDRQPPSLAVSESQPPPVSEAQGADEQAQRFSGYLSHASELQLEEGEEDELASPQDRETLIMGARTLLGMDEASTREQKKEEKPMSMPKVLLSEVGKILLVSPAYPITMIKVLIQLGYEPLPPQRRYSLIFRQYMYYYPGIYGYAKAIVKQDGWKALYRGVGLNIVEEIVVTTAHEVMAPIIAKGVDRLPLSVVERGADMPDTEENVETARAVVVRATRMFVKSVVTRSVVTLITHPFHVMTVRSIAQYIGGEEIYTSVWQSVREIYQEEGIAGFYSGIVPSLLGSVYSSAMYITLWSFFELLAINAPQVFIKVLIRGIIMFPLLTYIPRTYSYPFQLMSNVMAVNNCSLAAGLPPRMPVFSGSLDCYRHLRSFRLLYRGSAVILPRYAYKDVPA